jgi:hypothetical protein
MLKIRNFDYFCYKLNTVFKGFYLYFFTKKIEHFYFNLIRKITENVLIKFTEI